MKKASVVPLLLMAVALNSSADNEAIAFKLEKKSGMFGMQNSFIVHIS